MSKKLILFASLFIAAFLVLFALPRSANAVACASVPVGGSYTVTSDNGGCTFANTVDGVDNGGITINVDATLTINTGQTIAWTSGYSITINGTIAMSGGELKKTNLWLTDSDADGYPTSATQIAQDAQPTGGRRRKDISSGTNSSFTNVDDITEFDYDDTDNAIYYNTVCNGDCSVNNSSGSCVAVSAGENSLAVCKRCNGSSLTSVNIADNTQDAEGSNVCNATCKNCNGAGSCVNQGVEDLFGQCGTTNCNSGNCNGSGACGYITSGEGNCAACGTCAGATSSSCVNIADNTQDAEGSNVCNATCKNCNGAGSCVNQGVEDLFGQCGTTNCNSGNCNGSGACGYITSGEGNCAACGTCAGATSSSCVNIADNTQDAEGSNLCNQTCKNCNGSGSCVNQGVEDLFGQCAADTQYQTGGSPNYCQSRSKDGNCDGAGVCNDYGAWGNINEGSQCSGTDHCSGATYYTGYSCSSGSCSAQYGDIGCCQCSKCSAGNYCNSSNHTCTSLPSCSTCDSGFGYSSTTLASNYCASHSGVATSCGSNIFCADGHMWSTTFANCVGVGTPAIAACSNLTYGGYSDWVLADHNTACSSYPEFACGASCTEWDPACCNAIGNQTERAREVYPNPETRGGGYAVVWFGYYPGRCDDWVETHWCCATRCVRQ